MADNISIDKFNELLKTIKNDGIEVNLPDSVQSSIGKIESMAEKLFGLEKKQSEKLDEADETNKTSVKIQQKQLKIAESVKKQDERKREISSAKKIKDSDTESDQKSLIRSFGEYIKNSNFSQIFNETPVTDFSKDFMKALRSDFSRFFGAADILFSVSNKIFGNLNLPSLFKRVKKEEDDNPQIFKRPLANNKNIARLTEAGYLGEIINKSNDELTKNTEVTNKILMAERADSLKEKIRLERERSTKKASEVTKKRKEQSFLGRLFTSIFGEKLEIDNELAEKQLEETEAHKKETTKVRKFQEKEVSFLTLFKAKILRDVFGAGLRREEVMIREIRALKNGVLGIQSKTSKLIIHGQEKLSKSQNKYLRGVSKVIEFFGPQKPLNNRNATSQGKNQDDQQLIYIWNTLQNIDKLQTKTNSLIKDHRKTSVNTNKLIKTQNGYLSGNTKTKNRTTWVHTNTLLSKIHRLLKKITQKDDVVSDRESQQRRMSLMDRVKKLKDTKLGKIAREKASSLFGTIMTWMTRIGAFVSSLFTLTGLATAALIGAFGVAIAKSKNFRKLIGNIWTKVLKPLWEKFLDGVDLFFNWVNMALFDPAGLVQNVKDAVQGLFGKDSFIFNAVRLLSDSWLNFRNLISNSFKSLFELDFQGFINGFVEFGKAQFASIFQYLLDYPIIGTMIRNITGKEKINPDDPVVDRMSALRGSPGALDKALAKAREGAEARKRVEAEARANERDFSNQPSPTLINSNVDETNNLLRQLLQHQKNQKQPILINKTVVGSPAVPVPGQATLQR